jgi:hypothetical protein
VDVQAPQIVRGLHARLDILLAQPPEVLGGFRVPVEVVGQQPGQREPEPLQGRQRARPGQGKARGGDVPPRLGSLGAILLALFLAFWFWHSPLRRKLTRAEIDRYLVAVAKLALPAGEKQATLARLRAWAEADDGRPVYMLNLMRYFRELRRFPGTPEFQGTPEQANECYENNVRWLLLKRAGYPVVAGNPQSKSLIEVPQAVDDWSRILVVRYPSRRRFLSLLADHAYGPFEPYKLMALHLVLVPVAADVVIPDPRLLVGGTLLVLYLAAGWILAALP